MKKPKKHGQVGIMFDCPCGRKHRLLLGLGEVQVMMQAICKGKDNMLFTPRIETFIPTGRINGHNKPDYVKENEPIAQEFRRLVENYKPKQKPDSVELHHLEEDLTWRKTL